MMKTISLLVCLFFSATSVFASTYDVQCLNAKGRFSSCKVAVEEETVSLNYKMKSEQSLNTVIQGNKIKSLTAGEYARRRIGEAVGTALLSFGIGILVAFSKKKRDHIGVEYMDDKDKTKATLIQIPKKFGMALKQELKAVSGKEVIETQTPKK